MVNNDKQHPNGASTFTTEEVNGSNGVLGCHVFRERDTMNTPPLLEDNLQRRNGFRTISSLQQQVREMVGMNAREENLDI